MAQAHFVCPVKDNFLLIIWKLSWITLYISITLINKGLNPRIQPSHTRRMIQCMPGLKHNTRLLRLFSSLPEFHYPTFHFPEWLIIPNSIPRIPPLWINHNPEWSITLNLELWNCHEPWTNYLIISRDERPTNIHIKSRKKQ